MRGSVFVSYRHNAAQGESINSKLGLDYESLGNVHMFWNYIRRSLQSRRMRWAGHVARMSERRGVCRFWGGGT